MAEKEGSDAGEDKAAIVIKAYQDFDFDHEPFKRRARTQEQVADADYPEVDETWVRELEERAFHPEDHCPPPPKDLPKEHPLVLAWENLLEARQDLTENVDLVKGTNDYFQKRISDVIEEPEEQNAEIKAATSEVRKRLKRFAKKKLRDNLHYKKALLQRSMVYLYLYRDTPECEQKNIAEELLRQTEVIFCAHTTFPAIRSATHIFGPCREDGTLVMDHIYKTCVYVMNRFYRLLNDAKNLDELHELYEQMIMAVLVAIPHDYLEDFRVMTPGFLDVKISEHVTLDTRMEAAMRQASFIKRVPEHTNPYARNKEVILNCLHALTKPSKDSPNYKIYLRKQVIENKGLSHLGKNICAMVKTGDRLHNLNTLSAKSLQKQVLYLRETIEDVMAMVAAVQKETGATYLNDDMFSLNMAVLRVGSNLQKHYAKEIAELGLSEELNRVMNRTYRV